MKNLNIGVRLSLGFGVVLVLLVAVSIFASLRMHSSSTMTDDLVRDQVRNERLIDEWQQVVEVNAARSTAAYLAVEAADQASVEGQMKSSSARATEIQEKLKQVLDQPAEKARLEEVLSTRASYTAARAAVFKEKNAGNAEAAKQIYSSEMVVKRTAYLAALAKMAAAQRAEVDATAAAIRTQYESARTMLTTVSVIAVLLGIVFAFRITRAITVPLREAVRVA